MRLPIALAIGVLLFAAPSAAGSSVPPWTGGDGKVTPLEARAGAIVSALAGRKAAAECVSPTGWGDAGASLGFDARALIAVVPWTSPGVPAGYALLSPFVCRLTNRFLGNPHRRGEKICPTRAQPRARCAAYESVIEATQTLAHEAMHLAGIATESTAECFGMQLLPYAAWRLGASRAFALELGRDYEAQYRQERRDAPTYWSRECRDGGTLDLLPHQRGWPLPAGSFSLVAGNPAAVVRAAVAR
jgi:hypothetical protein